MTERRQNENRKEYENDKQTLFHSRTLKRVMGTLRPRSHSLLPYPTHSDEPIPSLTRGSYLYSSDNNIPTFDEPFEIVPILSKPIVDVDTLTDEEVRERMIRIMDDLSEENKTKEKIFQGLTPAKMRIMLSSHIQREAEEITDAEYQIQCLNRFTIDNINTKKCKETFEHVAFSLKKYSLKWSKIFGANLNGPNAMLKAMRACITKVQITRESYNQAGNERQLQEILGAGIEAFRNYFNLGWNFNSMNESLAKSIAEITIDTLNILSLDYDEHSIKIKSSCAILLFALAMPNENNPSNGQNIVELLSQSAEKWCLHRESFHCLVHELDGSIEVASSFLMCINAIFVTLTTAQRYHLRTGLFRSGFKTRFEELQRRVTDCQDPKQKENLSTQIELFLRHIDLDYQAMNIKFDSVSESWADLQSCFAYLYGLVKGSQSESLLLCILNRIICIRDDQTVRYSYLRLIDECIQRIVFSKTACDPDFDTYPIDSESNEDPDPDFNDNTSSTHVDSLNNLSQMAEHAKNNLQTTENQIQLDLMKGRIEHLEHTREKLSKALETVLTKIDTETANSLRKQYFETPSSSELIESVPTPSSESTETVPIPCSESSVSVLVPPSESTVSEPTLPPELIESVLTLPSESTESVLTPPPESTESVLTPPSESTVSDPALPPELIESVPTLPSESTESVLTPPPELTESVPTQPSESIESVPLPPPPPSLNGPPLLSFLNGPPPLPKHLQAKEKHVVGEAVKKVSWNKINPHSIKENSIWTNIDEKYYHKEALFTSIKENFATKKVPAISSIDKAPVGSDIQSSIDKASVGSDIQSSTPRTTVKEFRILDPRVGQNFAIIFRKLKTNPQQFREWLLTCDSEHLSNNLLAQLNKSLPSPEDLKRFSELKNEIDDLIDSEQYFCAISDIKHLHQRIGILFFKSEYKELLEKAEKQLVAGCQACETVQRSKRFPKLIELVLAIGNYMNSSATTYQPIHGFDISFLPKLHNTKTNDGKRTLLHFILQEIEQDHQDLLQFGDEFQGITGVASKIDIIELQRTLNSIKARVNNTQTDLDNAKNTSTDSTSEDLFVQTIEGFVKAAQDDIERLEALNIKMTNAYQDLCDYFAMDSNKCPLNEFFKDLKIFCTLFLTCLQENRLWREQDEKNKRAQMPKQRTEPKIKPESFFRPNDKDTDVVSNLMSVLKDANISSQPRRVRRPPDRSKVNNLRTKINDRENVHLLSEENIASYLFVILFQFEIC